MKCVSYYMMLNINKIINKNNIVSFSTTETFTILINIPETKPNLDVGHLVPHLHNGHDLKVCFVVLKEIFNI